ncbi:tetratricopeptide repeat-containing sulfotransferase family protein [uncultured Paraglaciecola sp.]|uniref:tetratricopeptide repeat-containing sulfotransferase family protein n=1 Tax=uncultured Paraglaciecola sp. TaxID=1765024 RepID=UPI002597AF36|nr:tetratricopeptide repeat-containing sulfotransferase family protein [uncultured Paraglaciecola sp.]
MNTNASQTDLNVDEIKRALQSNNIDKAIQLAQKLLATALPVEAKIEANYLLAVAQRSKGKIAEATKTIDQLINLNPNHARAYQELGYLSLSAADKPKAAMAFAKATRLNPALLASWQKLAPLYQEYAQTSGQQAAEQKIAQLSTLPVEIRGAQDLMYEGKLALADTVCRRFLQKHKHHVEAMMLLAEIGLKLKLYHEAEFLLESCIEIHPDHLDARLALVQLFSKLGKFSQAKEQAQLLLSKQAENPQYLAAKAGAMVGIGEVEQAIVIYQQILKQHHNLPGMQLLLGHAHKANGDIKQAVTAYQAAYTIRADFGDAYWSLANTKTYRFTKHELTQMQAQLEKPNVEQDDRVHFEFALAKTYEDSKQFDIAFNHYRQGNKLKNQLSHYSQTKLSEQINAQKSVFTSAFFESHKNVGDNNPAPIFILGLPRAGSTLLEQILASHSQVDGTMELHNILGLAAKLSSSKGGYPHIVEQIDNTYFARFGQQFIEQTQCYRQGAAFFIDKMPNNFMHIGLIKCILPNAKVIDARRDPIACCFSGYKQLFAEGQEFSYDLENMAHYYQSYQSLMKHWEEVLPGFVLRVQHEDVIEDLEGEVRRMLDFCQLPFETNCLDFHKTKRTIKTPSSEQVRQPINSTAKDQWKNFEKNLTPLIRAFTSK